MPYLFRRLNKGLKARGGYICLPFAINDVVGLGKKAEGEIMIYILTGSPRHNGNTASLLKVFKDELAKNNVSFAFTDLNAMVIEPCTACGRCQDTFGAFGCPIQDDMHDLFKDILKSRLFVLATPIYSWHCTPPMKAMLDRLVYGMNKYYGVSGQRECLWQGKKCALITTCGYPVEKGADLFEEGMKRYCKHSRLEYIGMLSARDEGRDVEFMSEQKRVDAVEFAHKIISQVISQ